MQYNKNNSLAKIQIIYEKGLEKEVLKKSKSLSIQTFYFSFLFFTIFTDFSRIRSLLFIATDAFA
jgi:hypothetical protein